MQGLHFIYYYADCHYAECYYAERCYTECHYAESHGTKNYLKTACDHYLDEDALSFRS